jgi:hypothetical protein
VTPQPQKRPRSSWTRFESDLPNETWQSDMTHWHLIDDGPGRDHQLHRRLLAGRAGQCGRAGRHRTRGGARSSSKRPPFTGCPASVLSDNGAIYTAAYRGSHTGMEIELATLGITFKHGKPYHPQTQGKVERYHLTLKKWLRKKPAGGTLAELQARSTASSTSTTRNDPTRLGGVHRCRPGELSTRPPSRSTGSRCLAHTKVRRDRVDKTGCIHLALSIQAPPRRGRPRASGQAHAHLDG